MLAHPNAYGVSWPCRHCRHPLQGELIEKTEAYCTSGTPGAWSTVACAHNAEILSVEREGLLNLQIPPNNSAARRASIGRACQGAGFHVTFSLAAALCDAVWPN